MAQFNLLDYEDRLEGVTKHNTWWGCVCPVCGGNLKISTASHCYGAYKCYTNGCDAKKIRQSVAGTTFFVSPFTSRRAPKPLITRPIIKEVPWPDLDIDAFTTDVTYVSPLHVNNTITYSYTESFKVIRIHLEDEVKVFTYRYNGIKGYPASVPLFTEHYIQPAIFIVEGEKCADFLHKHGFAAITTAVPYRQRHNMDAYVKALKDRGVKHCLYLRDNDTPGLNAALLFRQHAWQANLTCKHVNPAVLYEDIPGFDIADVDPSSLKKTLCSLLH